MRILADENVDSAMVAWLREQGHDVISVAQLAQGAADPWVLDEARLADRVLLTCDKDFGELVFHRSLPSLGVVLIRLRTSSRGDYLKILREAWPTVAENAEGRFTVVTNEGLRSRPMPRA